jgi:hypothetical protein
MRWRMKEFAVSEESAQVDSFASQEGGQDSFLMRSVVEKVEMEHIFFKYFGFPLSITISPILYVHSYIIQRTEDGAIISIRFVWTAPP